MKFLPMIRVPTFEERGLRRAYTLLGTSNFESLYDPLYQFTYLTQFLGGTGAETNLQTTPLADGGGTRLTTGGTAAGSAWRFMANFQVAALITTSGWMLRARFRQNQAIGTNTQLRMTMQGSNRELSIGVHGTGLTGGSATKFTMTKIDSGGVRRAGATSTVTLDTTSHQFEIWHPAGSSLLYGSVDEETPMSTTNADMGDGNAQVLFGTDNNADNSAYAMDLYEWQLITVRP